MPGPRTLAIIAAVTALVASVAVVAVIIGGGADRDEPLVERWQREVAADPADMVARLQLGYAYQIAGDRDAALSHYDAVLRREPRNTAALFNRATVLRESGKGKQAEVGYWDVLEIEPDHVEAAAQLGRYYAAKGHYRSVLEAVRPVVGVHPESAELQYLTGLAYEHLGEPGWAVARYRLALDASADAVEARDGLKRLGATP